MMNCSHLAATLIAALMGSSCTHVEKTLQEKPKLLKFATQHPIAATAIGSDDNSHNITSNAVRLSGRLGLDNSKNGQGRGTETNAMRHSLWQAAIAARFGENIAKKAGDAYEKNSTFRNTTLYPDRYSADEAVDLRNNAIGRRIGTKYPRDNMKDLAEHLLTEYHHRGLWVASSVKQNGKTVWQIKQQTLPKEKYQSALNKLEALDEYGHTPSERAKLPPHQAD